MAAMDKNTPWSQSVSDSLHRVREDQGQFNERFKSLSDENLYSLSAVDAEFMVESDIESVPDYFTGFDSDIEVNEIQNQCGNGQLQASNAHAGAQVLNTGDAEPYIETDAYMREPNQYAAHSLSDTYSNNTNAASKLVAFENQSNSHRTVDNQTTATAIESISQTHELTYTDIASYSDSDTEQDFNPYTNINDNSEKLPIRRTDTAFQVRNIKSELGYNKSNLPFYQTDSEFDDLIPPRPPLNEFDLILEEYARRKETRLEEEARLGQTRISSLDTDNPHLDDFYLDDGPRSPDKELGLFPMTRYGKMSDLSDAGTSQSNAIDDILNQTLETIAEESDEDHDFDKVVIANVLSTSQLSTQAEPRSDFNSLDSTPRKVAKLDHQNVENFVINSDTHNQRNWENDLNCELANSEILSDLESDYPDLNHFAAPATDNSENINQSDPPTTSVTMDTGQQPTKQDQNWYDDYDLEELPSSSVRIQWDKLGQGLYRPCLVENEHLTDSTSTLCPEDAENISSLDDDVKEVEQTEENATDDMKNEDHQDQVVPDESTVNTRISPEANEEADTELALEGVQVVPNPEITTEPPEREPFCNINKVSSQTDWDKVDLSCELTESVVLSDYVSDTASVASDLEDQTDVRYHDSREYVEEPYPEQPYTEQENLGTTSQETLKSGDWSSDESYRTPKEGSISGSKQSLPYYSPQGSLKQLYVEQPEFTTPAQVDLCDTGYFSRSQDRDSELDSMSSPQHAEGSASPPPEFCDHPLEGDPDLEAKTEVPQRVSRIKQLERRSSMSKEEFESAMQGNLVTNGKNPQESKESMRNYNSEESSPELSNDKHSYFSKNDAQRNSSGVLLPKLDLQKTERHDAFDNHSEAHSSPSNESVHEPHGDVESIKTAWYEDVEPSTPPVKSIKFAPFPQVNEPDNMHSPEAVSEPKCSIISDKKPDLSKSRGLTIDSKSTLQDKDRSSSGSERFVTTGNTLLITLSTRKASLEESQTSNSSHTFAGSQVSSRDSVLAEREMDEINLAGKNVDVSPQTHHKYETSVGRMNGNVNMQRSNAPKRESPKANTEEPIFANSQQNTTAQGSEFLPHSMPRNNAVSVDNTAPERYTFTIDKKYEFKVDTRTSMSDHKISYANHTSQTPSNQVCESEPRKVKYSPPLRVPYEVVNESVDSSDKSQIASSSLRNFQGPANKPVNNSQYLTDRSLKTHGKHGYAYDSPVQTNTQMDNLTAFQDPKQFATKGNIHMENYKEYTHKNYQPFNPGGQDKLNRNGASSSPAAMLIPNTQNGDNVTREHTNSPSQRENLNRNIGILDKPKYKHLSQIHNSDGTVNPFYTPLSAHSFLPNKGLAISRQSDAASPKNLEQCSSMGQGRNKQDIDLRDQTSITHEYGNQETQSRSDVPPLPKKSALEKLPKTQDITQNIIQHGSLEDRSHENNTYENVVVAYRPRQVTAQATSTALARKDFKLSASQDSKVLADSVVSAVASAEATGENPYIAVARATARAASIATASAAQSASTGDQLEDGKKDVDNRDITIMISTSCTIQNGDDGAIQESARGVVKALNSDANVAVYTRLAPGPKALLSKDQSHRNNVKKLKVSIEQTDNDANEQNYPPQHHTVEIAIPEGLDSEQLNTMVTEAVSRVLTPNTSQSVNQDQNYDSSNNIQSRDIQAPMANKEVSKFSISNTAAHGIKTTQTESEKFSENKISANSGAPYVSTTGYFTRKQNEQPFVDSSNMDKSRANTDVNNATYSKQGTDRMSQNTQGSAWQRSGFKDNVSSENSTQFADQIRENYSSLRQRDNRPGLPSQERTAFDSKYGKANGQTSELRDNTKLLRKSANKDEFIRKDYSHTRGVNDQATSERSTKTHQSSERPVAENKHHLLIPAPENGSQNRKHEYKYRMNGPQQSSIYYNGSEDKRDNGDKNSSNTISHKSSSMHSERLHLAEDYVRLSRDNGIPLKDKNSRQANLQQKLNKQLQAPNSAHIDEQWEQAKQSGNLYRSDRPKATADDAPPRRNFERVGYYGSLPRTFFTNTGSRTSLVETDLDTGLRKEQPVVLETDLDFTHRASRARSYGNLPQNATEEYGENAMGSFEKTQSMTSLQNPNNGNGANVTSAKMPQNGTHKSENEVRLNNSLNKLNVPNWYNSAALENDQGLRNTRRKDITSGAQYHGASPAREGVSARIVTTKPVVIQHRVVTPVIRKSPQLDADNFQLPSTKWRQKEGSSFKPIPIKALHEINICREDMSTKTPAREAYLKLIADENKNSDSSSSNNHNYMNIPSAAPNSEGSDDTPPPLPPRRAPRSSASTTPSPPVHDTGTFYSPNTQPKTVVQINGTMPPNGQHTVPPAPNTRGYPYDGIQEHTHAQPYGNDSTILARGNPGAIQQAYNNPGAKLHDANVNANFNERATPYKTNSSHYTNGPLIHDNTDKYKLDTYMDSNANTAEMSRNSAVSQNKSRTVDTHVNSTSNTAGMNTGPNIRDEPVFDRAIQSRNRLVSDFATDIEKELDIIRYDESPKRRRLPSSNDRPKSCDDDVFQDGGRLNDSRAMETSLDESRANVSLDEILGGLLNIPKSPNTSTGSYSRSRTGSRRHGSSTSSTQSLETPQERLFRMLRMGSQNADRSMDSSISKVSSTGDSPERISPRDPASPQASGPQSSVFDSSLDNGEVDDNLVTVKCRNSKCKRQMNLANARHTYKTCHNCFTYYCSRECRKEHWERHKKKCVFSRVSSHCKHLIRKVHDDSTVCEEFSKVARTGFIQKGRGCVIVAFASVEKADSFLQEGISVLQVPLAFVSMKEIEESQLFGDQLFELIDMCRTYNPEVKFVIDAIILSDQPSQGTMPRREGLAVKKCSKLRLTNAQTVQKVGLPQLEDNDTLILTAVPGSEFTENMEEKKAREICFANIQRKLRQRGVRLRHQYPEVYNKLCAYVANKEEFAPITLFPVDGNTGKKFMCLIMPNSEPEIEWLNKPDLLDELGLNTEV